MLRQQPLNCWIAQQISKEEITHEEDKLNEYV